MNKENIVIFGDQSPWMGGWIRHQAVANLGFTTQYLIQDADVPWRQDGVPFLTSKRGWTDYWSLATRIPWAWSTPDIQIPRLMSAFGGPQHGLIYLAGPNTRETIHSKMNQQGQVAQLSKKMLVDEAKWAGSISDAQSAKEWVGAIESCSTLADIYDLLGSQYNVERAGVIDFFADNPPLLIDYLGNENYWSIDRQGHRHDYSEKGEYTTVPKGPVFIMELCAKGLTLGYTGLGYLEKVVKLRDKKIPGLQLNLLQVLLNWTPTSDPVTTMVDIFFDRKEQRGQTANISAADTESIREYWMSRPTSISSSILGGEINSELNWQTY